MKKLLAVLALLACGGEQGPNCEPQRCDAASFPLACLHGAPRGGVCEGGWAFAVDCRTGERALLCVRDGGM